MLNIEDRIITDISEISYDEILYNTANVIIEAERKKAQEYLIRALGI